MLMSLPGWNNDDCRTPLNCYGYGSKPYYLQLDQAGYAAYIYLIDQEVFEGNWCNGAAKS